MSLKYQNNDIQKLAQDLTSVLLGIEPGTGVSISGFDIDPIIEIVDNEELTIEDSITSISIIVTGESNAIINSKSIPSGLPLNFSRGIDKPFAPNKFTIDATDTVVLVIYNKVVTS